MYKTKLVLLFLLLNIIRIFMFDQIIVQAADTNIQLPALHVQEKTLKNGITLLVQENHAHDLVAFEIIVKTGSIYESDLQGSGIAHLVEHMLFKGTLTRPAGEIEDQVKFLGGTMNGYTSHQITGYTLVVPAANYPEAIDLLSDMIKNPLFDDQELQKEKNVILSEIKMNQDDPGRLLSRKFWEYAYNIAPYNLPVIGLEPLFNSLERKDLVNFYNKWYMPNNVIIAVSGAVQADLIEQSLEKAFSDFAIKPYPQIALPTIAPVKGIKSQRIPFDVNVAQMIVGFPSVVLTDPDSAALDIIATILGQGDSSLLHNSLLREKKLVYSVGAFNYTPGFRGVFAINCMLDKENEKKVLNAIFEQFDKLKNGKISNADIEKAKNLYLNDYFLNQQSVQAQASSLATDYAYTADINFTRNYINQLSSISAKDIQRCAKKYLNQENYLCVILEPISPDNPQEKTQVKTESAIKEITFPNGLRLVLKHNPQQPIVSIGLSAHGGTRWETDQDNGLFNLMSILMTKGTNKRSAEDIAQSVESLGASVSGFSGYNSFGLQFDCLSKDLVAGIELFSDMLLNSSFPEKEIEISKKLVQKEIAIQDDDIFRNTFNLARKALFASYPYRLDKIGNAQSVEALDRKILLAKKNAFLIPENMVITVFGDFDQKEVEKLIDQKISKLLKSGEIAAQPVFNEPLKTEQKIVENKRDKQQAVLVWAFPGCDIYSPDRQGLEFLNDLLISSGSILYKRIREKAGMSYTMGGSSISGLDTGFFYFYVATTSESLDDVKSIIIEEINKAKNELIAVDIIEPMKNYVKGSSKLSRQANSSLGFIVGLDVLYGLGSEYYQHLDQRIKDLTAEEIQWIARKYLVWDKSVLVITKDNFDD
ncbi:MAG: insulinase family protein [Candidatus Omnitrophica bacterium]|nr:insulinase family protein [Candidatus Omnitrophota bacterium]